MYFENLTEKHFDGKIMLQLVLNWVEKNGQIAWICKVPSTEKSN